LFAFALIVGAFFSFRFGSRWAEADTAYLANTIRAMVRDATLLSPSGDIYPSGFAFGAVSTFILAFAGVSLPTLLQSLYPLVSASVVIVAWPVYRELTGSAKGATLATLVLFIQPEFLFVILRGSHERVLRVLLLISIWLLVRSIRMIDRPRAYATYVLLFYVIVFGVLATNSLFASSYVWALGLALVGSWFATFLGPRLRVVSTEMRHRLLYVPVFCAVLTFIFNEYVYPPATHSLRQLTSVLDRLNRLLLTTSPEGAPSSTSVTPFDPYATVVDQWIDLKVYFVVSSGTYILMIASVVIWGRLGLRWLAGKGEAPTLGQWLLWLLYAAFALQGALSILADRTGSLEGNLQYRSFPSFVMVAAPVVALSVVHWRPGRRARALAALGLGLLALFAVAKATNEPSISNKWTFYIPEEVEAIEFAEQHLVDSGYWSDFDERIRAAQTLLGLSTLGTHIGRPPPGLRSYLISNVTRLRAARLNRPLPPVGGELRVYDNGAVQIYRTRPATPYQD
jgi:hypothetical protein